MPQIYVEGGKKLWQAHTGISAHSFAVRLIDKFGREFFDAHATTMSVNQVSGAQSYVRFWTKSLHDQKVRVYHLEFEIMTEPLLRMKHYIVAYTTCTEVLTTAMVSISKRKLAELQAQAAQACLNGVASSAPVYYDHNSDPRKKARYEF